MPIAERLLKPYDPQATEERIYEQWNAAPAAIATQVKVKELIYKTEGKARFALGREEFLKRVEAFAAEKHDEIVGQIKKLGASVDWSREAFTLDEARSRAVRAAFKQFYDAG